MRTTGVFETHKRTLSVVANKTISIIFFGDVHAYSPMHCDKIWQEFKNKFRHRQNCYYVAMGDFLDLLSARERKLMGVEFHESTSETLEDFYQSLINKFADEIGFMKGKLIVMLEGNHHIKFCDGTTTAQKLCAVLNTGLPDSERVKYVGDCAMVQVVLNEKKQRASMLTLALHHGIGAGRTVGASYNPIERMSIGMEADVYAMGDNHQRGAHPITRLYLTHGNNTQELKVRDREIYLIRTGSFLRGFVKGKASYVTDKLFNPTNLGWIELQCMLKRDQSGGKDDYFITLDAIV